MDIFVVGITSIGMLCIVIALSLLLWPSLVRSVETLIISPLLGFVLFALLLAAMNLAEVSNHIFLLSLFVLSIAGGVRGYREYMDPGRALSLKRNGLSSLFIVFLVCLPIGANLATSAFVVNDEIYSWNYWARLVYQQKSADFYFTQAVYPQLFSHVLGGFYIVLGSLDMQVVVRLLLYTLPVCCYAMIFYSSLNNQKSWLLIFLFIANLYILDFDDEFQLALADPMMGVFLVAGLYCLLNAERFSSLSVANALLISSLFIAASALTKQAALLWSIFIYPVAMLIYILERKLPIKLLIFAFIPVATSIIWLLTSGSGFQNNEGVIQASLQDRSLLSQVAFATNKYIHESPQIFIVFALYSWGILRYRTSLNIVIYVGCLISALLWLLFGSYEIRLGMHVFLVLFLLFAYSLPQNLVHTFKAESNLRRFGRFVLPLVLIASFCSAIINYIDGRKSYQHTLLLDGFSMQLNFLMGEESSKVIQELSVEPHKVLTTSNYVFGALYGFINVVRPPIMDHEIDKISVAGLSNESVTHVFMSDPKVAFGRVNSYFEMLLERCPNAFKLVNLPTNYLGLSIYEVSAKGASLTCR